MRYAAVVALVMAVGSASVASDEPSILWGEAPGQTHHTPDLQDQAWYSGSYSHHSDDAVSQQLVIRVHEGRINVWFHDVEGAGPDETVDVGYVEGQTASIHDGKIQFTLPGRETSTTGEFLSLKDPETDFRGRGVLLHVGQHRFHLKKEFGAVVGVSASSQRMTKKGAYVSEYAPENLLDRLPQTAWVAGGMKSGIGECAEFYFSAAQSVEALLVSNGYQKSDALFKANNRVKRLRVHYDDRSTEEVTLKDASNVQQVILTRRVATRSIRFEIIEVFRGEKYNDTCLSGLDLVYANK